MDKSHIFFYSLLAFCGGIFGGSFFDIPKTIVLAAALVCVALIAVFFRKGSRLVNFKITLAAFLAIFFSLGISRYNAVHSKQQNLTKIAEAAAGLIDPQNKHPIKVALYGYVDDEPMAKGDKQQFVFIAKEIETLSRRIPVGERVLVTSRLYPKYEYGQVVKIFGELKLPQNFESFDYISYLAKDDIFTVSYYPEISENSIRLGIFENLKVGFFRAIFKVKNAFEASVSRSVHEPNAAFVNGILLGSRAEIPTDIKNDFARTSTTHILAISGYNITIIAAIFSWFFLFFFRRPVAFWFSVAGIAVFAILTGAQASVIRAAIMGVLVLLARREGRLSDPRNALALTGALMVFINPRILRYDIGFQLSFAATVGLIYIAPLVEKYFEKLPNFFNFRETFVMTLSAQLFVLPLLIYYFKNFSLVSLPANVIVLPIVPFAMLLGALTGVAGLILPFLGQLVGYFAWLVSAFELGVIKLFAKPNWAAVSAQFNWYMVALAYAAIICFLLWLSRKKEITSTHS
jgi:competence protein ComEC